MSKVKKILALLMAVVMTLGMTVTVFAAKTGAKITVKGLSTANVQEVKAYEIFKLDLNDNGWVKNDWVPQELGTDMNLKDPKVVNQLVDATKDVTADYTEKTETGKSEVVFDDANLQAGAYLIIATDTGNKVTYNPMVAVTYKYDANNLLVANTETEITAKAESYTTEKDLKDNDDIVGVGDLITYTIKTTVPYNDGTLGEFWISDTLSGATYCFNGEAVKGVTPQFSVTVGGNSNVVTTVPDPIAVNEKQQFVLDLSNLIENELENKYAGQEVVITYTAKVNAVDTITNTAVSTNDPDSDTGITTAQTGQISITKYGEKDKEGKYPKLAGAEFVIYRMNQGSKEYAVLDENGYVTGQWIDNKNDVKNHVVTNTNGVATVKGLDVGIYYFEEVIAPDGYSVNSTEFPDCEITVKQLSDSAEMYDTKLSSLPSTGGIGTTIFTIGGCAIMVTAAGLYFATRKKTEK